MNQGNKPTGLRKNMKPAATLPDAAPMALALLAIFSLPATAQSIDNKNDDKLLPRIEVLGQGGESIAKLPGSVALITKETLVLTQPVSVQDALKVVPGVVVREEEGYGFIPNIGLRGLDPNRSQKVLVLEDGVPVAPSLFISNESYYSPRVERMESIEVLKGAAGLRYGPTTIGGVINYQTKQPENGVRLTAKGGSHGYQLLGIDAGGKSVSGDAVGGISAVTAKGDGYRHNGFTMEDVVVKGGMAVGDKQWLSAKFTHYNNDVNTSYVGLRPNEYLNNPTKNPAPQDYFLSERNSFDLNHEVELGNNAKLQTLVYWSQLQRDYWRRNVSSKNSDGTTFVACGGTAYCMTGAQRTFDMTGIDSRLELNHTSFGIRNETEIGLRFHHESRLNQTRASKTDPNARTGDLTADQDSSVNSLAFYGQNRFVLNDKLAITPGVRIESYTQKDTNVKTAVSGSASNTEVVPGIGATWQVNPAAQIYTGVFKGFSPAMLAASIIGGVDQRLEAERSTNVELGIRGAANGMRYEATLFSMDFANQIINQSASAGITRTNAGKTLNQGLEGALGVDLTTAWSVESNLTYLPTAKYNSNRTGSTDNVQNNRLPYAPKLTANASLNFKSQGWSARLSAHHVATQFVDALNTVAQSADGEKGEIPAYTSLNLNARYAFDKQTSVFAAVRNLTDKKYIASRQPSGIFTGAERNVEVGVTYKF